MSGRKYVVMIRIGVNWLRKWTRGFVLWIK